MNKIFRLNGMGAFPVLIIALFAILLIILIPLFILGIAGAAFSRLGFSWFEAVAVIILMIIGYFINIPLWKIRNPVGNAGNTGEVYDAFTGEPVGIGEISTTISINLGGALIPVIVSCYLLYEVHRHSAISSFLPIIACICIVAIIAAVLTKVIPHWGVSTPLLFPSIAAIGSGILLTGGTGLEAAVTAFVGGTWGILLGATVIMLMKWENTDMRQISVGGAGMFGSVFLCALLSALIA